MHGAERDAGGVEAPASSRMIKEALNGGYVAWLSLLVPRRMPNVDVDLADTNLCRLGSHLPRREVQDLIVYKPGCLHLAFIASCPTALPPQHHQQQQAFRWPHCVHMLPRSGLPLPLSAWILCRQCSFHTVARNFNRIQQVTSQPQQSRARAHSRQTRQKARIHGMQHAHDLPQHQERVYTT